MLLLESPAIDHMSALHIASSIEQRMNCNSSVAIRRIRIITIVTDPSIVPNLYLPGDIDNCEPVCKALPNSILDTVIAAY